MPPRTKALGLPVLMLLLALGPASCVPNESLDPTLALQYQRHLVDKGPQTRHEQDPYRPVPGTTGPALDVRFDERTERRFVPLTLQEVLYRSLANNPAIQVLAYEPAIARQDIVEAEAAFDWVLGSTVNWEKTDLPNRSSFTAIRGESLAVQATGTKRLITGGELELRANVTRREENLPAGVLSPSYQSTLAAQLTQPLLRGAGPEVNLAAIRVARLNNEVAIEAFRAALLDELLQIETLYWQLVRARQELQIQDNLVRLTEQLRERIMARWQLDASRVEIAQSVAALESRRAQLIRARRVIGDIEDQILARMSDASAALPDDVAIVPTTPPAVHQVLIDPADQLAMALKYSPELSRARAAIRINRINVRVARNLELPVLNVQGSTQFDGFEQELGDSLQDLANLDFINYNLALAFEWPVGNRAGAAGRRRALLSLDRSIAALQGTADQVALAIRQSLRQINATYDEIQADENALGAAIENRDALDARLQILGQLTPEALQLQLQAQENVATAERTLLQAQVDYNIALAGLARANGTSLRQAGVLIEDVGEDYVRLLTERVKTTAGQAEAPEPPDDPPGYPRWTQSDPLPCLPSPMMPERP